MGGRPASRSLGRAGLRRRFLAPGWCRRPCVPLLLLVRAVGERPGRQDARERMPRPQRAQVFATPMGIYQPSSGALYPALRRLEVKGLIRAQAASGPAGESGRPRRVYEPTQAGRAAHVSWLRAPVAPATVARDLGLHLMRFVMMEHLFSREEVLGFLRTSPPRSRRSPRGWSGTRRAPTSLTSTRAWPLITGWPSTGPACSGPSTPSRPSPPFPHPPDHPPVAPSQSSQRTTIRLRLRPGSGKESASAVTASRSARDSRRQGCTVSTVSARRHVPAISPALGRGLYLGRAA